jgi:hypothetical protein
LGCPDWFQEPVWEAVPDCFPDWFLEPVWEAVWRLLPRHLPRRCLGRCLGSGLEQVSRNLLQDAPGRSNHPISPIPGNRRFGAVP